MHPPDALRVDGLRFRYRRGAGDGAPPGGAPWTLDIGSLRLARGEQALLTGGSGSGKSTLLHLIAGLEDPDEGLVEVAGHRVHELRGAERDLFRGRHIGMIFQTFNLLHGFTALENVLAALMFSTVPRAEHRERASAALQRLGIDRIHARPDQLSVGQQQRVAVARAVVCEPELVLADEPTASLDPENAREAVSLIRGTCRERGAALLCVSHDPALPAMFERRIRLADLAPGAGTPASVHA